MIRGATDEQLVVYIKQIFQKYDIDRSGSLDAGQLSLFFTDLYRSLGYNVTIGLPQAQQALATIDINHDGRLTPEELFNGFKHILQSQHLYVENIRPIQQNDLAMQQMYQQNPQLYQQMQYGNMTGTFGQQQPVQYIQQPIQQPMQYPPQQPVQYSLQQPIQYSQQQPLQQPMQYAQNQQIPQQQYIQQPIQPSMQYLNQQQYVQQSLQNAPQYPAQSQYMQQLPSQYPPYR